MILVWWSSGLSAPFSTIVWYFCRGEVVTVTVGEQALLVKGSDLHTFGSRSNHGGDFPYSLIPVEVQCGKRGDERADALTLPPSVLPGEYRGGDGERRGVSHI